MGAIVLVAPALSTYVAKVIAALAGHVVTAVNPFDNEVATLALSVLEVLLKELHLSLVAFPVMSHQQAF